MEDISFIGKSMRLDKFLMQKFPSATLSEIYKWIRTGKIKVNRKKQKPSYRLNPKETVSIFLTDKQINDYQTKGVVHKVSFNVLFEDEDMLVVDKPPYLASQGGIGVNENNLVNQVNYYLKKDAKISLGNRLDKDTSGIIILGKNPKMNALIYNITKSRQMEKKYFALAIGRIRKKTGTFKDFLAKGTRDFQPVMKVSNKDDSRAKYCETTYKVVKHIKNYSLLELTLKTGRMHQIRVQLASRGFPVLGDKIYGNEDENKKVSRYLKRQFLHAYQITFNHPITNKKLKVTSELPRDLKKTLEKIKAQ
ncbi:RluA family pseudouridine synthase [Candidatus Woesearchaeota archaeon]|jgi:RluA family pseudouridine synthase|nr:RluA family pseudouridine synthase [Candidatus Woesearchaeota archaeon]MBT6044890.1 RluA family pseudouridine synthase [Candidatus Woesearchaeota archaeon]